MPVSLDHELYISTSNANVIMVGLVCPSYTLSIEDHDLVFDLMVLKIRDFDVILGMDWLISYYDLVDYFEKRVTF